MKKAIAMLLLPAFSFAQNATWATEYVSPYYPLVNSPYIAAAITLIRDITIIAVLWLIYFKLKEKDKPEKKEK